MSMSRLAFGAVWMCFLAVAAINCVGPDGQQGPQGSQGPMGTPGKDAMPSLADCPFGYTRDQSEPKIVLCKKGDDEVVRVGTGQTAFWVDRYEASVWEKPDGIGTQYPSVEYPPTFPRNGQTTVPLYAASKAGVFPSGVLTWFQANEACRASGKRLPTGAEWLSAARGTLDPGDSSGAGGSCVTNASPVRLRQAGGGSKCVSDWGAQDMVGNMWEWTEEWYASGDGTFSTRWPQGYGDDEIQNVRSAAQHGDKFTTGLPSATLRGGSLYSGTSAGIFAFALSQAPSAFNGSFGFRCVVPR